MSCEINTEIVLGKSDLTKDWIVNQKDVICGILKMIYYYLLELYLKN
jgi:hypothetical protein